MEQSKDRGFMGAVNLHLGVPPEAQVMVDIGPETPSGAHILITHYIIPPECAPKPCAGHVGCLRPA